MTSAIELLKRRLVEPCRYWKRCKNARYDALDYIKVLESKLDYATAALAKADLKLMETDNARQVNKS